MWRSFASNALTVMIALLFVAAALIQWGKAQYVAPGPLAQTMCLRVETGDNFSDVADRLEAMDAVKSRMLFLSGVRYTDRSGDLKAGAFLIHPGASMDEITESITGTGRSTCGVSVDMRIGIASMKIEVDDLNPTTGRYEEVFSFDPSADEAPAEFADVLDDPAATYNLIFAEGVTSWQVAQALTAAPFLTGTVDEQPDEGSVAPQSYEVQVGDNRNDVIARMQARQTEILQTAWENRADDLPYEDIEDALIMASIVEKETGLPEERPQVASVFVNRLRQGMRLQTDPTVIYGVLRGEGVLGRGLRRSELDGDTPWNTYVRHGLPLTPIANPGQSAIEAALTPDATPYLFFVADGTGGHAFAQTLAEHNRNVARWREIEAQRNKE